MSPVILILAALQVSQGAAEPPAAAPVDPIEGFQRAAGAYDIRLDDAQTSRVVLRKQPLLHWSNPARTSEDGAVFIWTLRGRPEVIGSVFTYKLNEVRTKHEFHSLATVPLTASLGETLAWRPPGAGVVFRAIPESVAPAESPRLRTIQLKNLAREFSASLINEKNEATVLRLLPQPLYRYELEAGGGGQAPLDGAIFSFALGTDPEAILLLEARKPAAGAGGEAWEWQYALARFHFDGVIARHKDAVVYQVDRDNTQMVTKLGDPASRDKIYVTYHVE